MKAPIRLLISGGPGSGCTTTAAMLSEVLGVPLFDSDSFFHKPSDPPFQELYAPDERRNLLTSALANEIHWIISGSIATWGLPSLGATHGILLEVPQSVRLQRLATRQRDRFGVRIDCGGDMHDKHTAFMAWAAGYETASGSGRNLETDRAFLLSHCDYFSRIDLVTTLDVLVQEIVEFIHIFKY